MMSSTSLYDGGDQSLTFQDTRKAIAAELRKAARRARAPQPILSGGGGFRARKSDRYFGRLLIFLVVAIFIIPVCLAGAYYSFVAADQYVTEARFAVKSGGENSVGALSALSSLIDTGQARDGLIIADYVKSTALLSTLSKQFDLRKIFTSVENDFIARLKSGASTEDLREFWGDQISVAVDRNSGLVTLKVRAFTAEDSLALARTIIADSEHMVNQLTRQNEADNLERARRELDRSRSKLEETVSELRDSRNKAGVLDVDTAAQSYMDLLTGLRQELSKQELLLNIGATGSPQRQPILNRIRVLREQIAKYEGSIAGQLQLGNGRTNLAEVATQMQRKVIEHSIAKDNYADAMAAYEAARIVMERQRSYLLTYVDPILPDQSTYPKRILMFLSILAIAGVMAASAVGIAVLVRDHMAK
jgi:capsular polysaccharide transport system permease protein